MIRPSAIVLILPIALVSSLPNIRILVNNENFQNPPYLLESMRQVDGKELLNSQELSQSSPSAIGANVDETEANLGEDFLQSESIPRASDPFKLPASELIEAVDQELNRLRQNVANVAPESTAKDDSTTSLTNNGQQAFAMDRKPQLPVTNAHLKKPAEVVSESEPSELVMQKSGGAKSLITASIASEPQEKQTPESSKELKKSSNLLPDVWEPSQVMQGVTNASQVPASITREYGKHSRTRITLGGGYVRDKLPAPANPASPDYTDNKPEKPKAPLESAAAAGAASSSGQPERGMEEVSRVIEVPERIILPDSPLVVLKGSSEKSPAVQQQKPAGAKLDSRCPSKGNLTFEHSTACDKYFICENGFISEQTCPNGLMYGSRDIVRDHCVHRWSAVCDDKSIPNPISSPGCRWQNGIFNVQGSPKCTPDFYECTDGRFEVKKCSIEGQVYDDRTKSCQFAERVGCATEALADFQCPPDDQANTYWPFPRYFLNERALIHCINDKPEIVRCTNEERVDPEHLHCVPINKATDTNLESRKVAREKKKSP